jgi:hypothetical protein
MSRTVPGEAGRESPAGCGSPGRWRSTWPRRRSNAGPGRDEQDGAGALRVLTAETAEVVREHEVEVEFYPASEGIAYFFRIAERNQRLYTDRTPPEIALAGENGRCRVRGVEAAADNLVPANREGLL